MSSRVYIDFETRSLVDIRKLGAFEYANDESTDILCLAFAIDDGPVGLWTPDNFLEIERLLDAITAGADVEAHNASFERDIWEAILVPRYGFPEIAFEQWSCSMAKAAIYGLPQSLGGLAKALRLPIEKDDVGRRIMLKLTKPRTAKQQAKDGRVWNEDPEDLQALYDYCIRDVEVERAASKKLPDPTDRERRVWLLDQKINRRGIAVDRELCRGAIAVVEEVKVERSKELAKLTDGEVTAPTQVKRLGAWLWDNGLDLQSINAEMFNTLVSVGSISDRCWLPSIPFLCSCNQVSNRSNIVA